MRDHVDSSSCCEPEPEPPLGRWPVFYYGVGHMLNDVTSACWFTYLLVFLNDIGLSPKEAAVVMLSGQLADGFMTVFAGELIDRFGHFKVWYAAGSILVAISFSSVFGGCILCKISADNSFTMQTVGYSFFAAVFNIGWAATQVAHMSMVNCMTLNASCRVVLASCRNAFTMVANLTLYVIAFVVFKVAKSDTSADVENEYRWIAYTSIFIGCCFVSIFFIGTKEPRLTVSVQGKHIARVSWGHWLRKVLYHQVAAVYMLTRLVTNVSQALIAFYVITDLGMAQSSKAVIPAIIYVCSFIVSVVLQEMTWTGPRLKFYFSAGGVLWVFCGVGVAMLPRHMNALMHVISILIGVANALMTVTGVSMQSALVGVDLCGSAFVYGSLSFLDKMACGLALYILESYETLQLCSAGCFSITRYGAGLLPAVCALLGVVITYTMNLGKPEQMTLAEPLLV